MKFTPIKQTLISFTVFLTILALGSCSVADDTAPPGGPTAFQQDIENATTVPNFTTAKSPLTREVLTPLGASASATLEKRYVTESGAGSRDGSSWATAWAATNLRNAITNITDATASRVYLVMVAGGTYKPTYTTSRGDSFSMTNHVAIMGGFDPAGGWGRTGITILSGDVGTAGDSTDNSYHVFFHNNITLSNAHLYGVTITNGNANGGSAPQQVGGGMYNNTSSSPVLTEVVFSGNTATAEGGGMYNILSSSPVLTRVVFNGNSAVDGGGMYNNTSSPVIIGTVFRNNTAANGGAMWNDNNGRPGPLIVNTIFSANTLSGAGSGTNIAMNLGGVAAENIRIAGSVLGIGLAQPTNAIVGFGGSAPLNISNHSLANGVVNFGADANLTINGMSFPYPTITGGSAVNLGLFVRKHVNGSTTTYYFSETGTGTSWHTGFTSTGAGGLDGTAMDLPTTGTIEDLTATDIAGNARNARPDAGVHELP